MKIVFALSTVAFCCCAIFGYGANAKVIVVNSDNADYDGKKITLHGAVVVDHPIGVLSANEVVMQPKEGVDGELSSVALADNVGLKLSGGGNLSCGQAFIDLEKENATCCGDRQRNYVVYTETIEGKKDDKIPVILKCKTLLFDFADAKDSSLKDRVRLITATGSVTISYNHDFIASSNKAVYQKLPSSDDTKELSGKIILTNEEGTGSCLVTNQNGDMVYANEIEINTKDHQLVLDKPKGSFFCNTDKEAISVRSDGATWDEKSGVITLTGHVEVNNPSLGQLQSDEVLLISSGNQCKKWVRAEAKGDSTLVYKAHDNPYIKTVKCYGFCVLDNEKMIASLTSPQDNEGKVLEDRQVFYSDEKGEIFADRVLIEYKLVGKESKPSHINLSGHVKILNKLVDPSIDTKQDRQYILADVVDFYPDTQQMILSATKGRRVLFYDEENDFQMSAKDVKTVRDTATKKDSIEASGDVRFHLVDSEIEKIQKQFSFEKITNKALHKGKEEK